MISEKGLVRAMIAAWKHTGYTVSVRGRMIYIGCNFWDMIMPVETLPRKVLALLVEHIGCILKDGEAYSCGRGTGVQMVTPMVIFDRMDGLIQISLMKPGAKTKLSFGDAEIWQSFDDLSIIGIDPKFAGIVDEKERADAYIYAPFVVWEGTARVRIAGEKLPDMVKSVLSGTQWGGEG